LAHEVKRINADLISREKIHFQKQYDFLNKSQALDEEIESIKMVAEELDFENNDMWAEIN